MLIEYYYKSQVRSETRIEHLTSLGLRERPSVTESSVHTLMKIVSRPIFLNPLDHPLRSYIIHDCIMYEA